jgi:hypothetical protein
MAAPAPPMAVATRAVKAKAAVDSVPLVPVLVLVLALVVEVAALMTQKRMPAPARARLRTSFRTRRHHGREASPRGAKHRRLP